jgi:bifunctional DNA-binding transcriptional regulator/antitoxin component of YhaV-PrlF toxin-antitoxin module
MTTLTVTTRGQVTFRKDVLQHLGIRPGEKIELDLLPDGRGVLKAARQTGTIAGFVGLLAGRTKKVATIEEINAATAPRTSEHCRQGLDRCRVDRGRAAVPVRICVGAAQGLQLPAIRRSRRDPRSTCRRQCGSE